MENTPNTKTSSTAPKSNGVYSIACLLTGLSPGTTPAVFEKRAKAYGVDVDTLKANYVGRDGASHLKRMVAAGETVPDAIAKIRKAYDVSADAVIDKKITNHILETVFAKRNKAKEKAAAKAKADKAKKALMG